MTPQDLLAEITAGPLAAELAPRYAAGNDAAVAAALNRADRPHRRPVDIVTLSGFCVVSQVTGKCRAMSRVPVGADIAPGLPMTLAVAGLLDTVMTIIQDDYRLSTADLDDPATGQILDGLQGIGVLDAPTRAAMLALQDAPRSRAAELGWPAVTQDDVHRTREISQ